MQEKNRKGVIKQRITFTHPRNLLSGICCGRCKTADPRQKHSGERNRLGFTLIELLVVVLIIGILAAVAVPQYQVAVLKTRYANLMANVKAVHDAEEVYYLANGSYTDDPALLDYIVGCDLHPEGRAHYGGYVFCNSFDIDVNAGWASHHPMGFIDFRLAYTHHQDHGTDPGVRECFAKTDDTVANKVCKSFGGVEVRTATGVVDAGGNVTVYQLN